MTEKQQQAIEILNKMRFHDKYSMEQITADEYYLLMNFVLNNKEDKV